MKTTKLLFKIPKIQLIIGLFLGIAYSIIFYHFLLLFKKSVIVFDALLKNYELFHLSEKENTFYNFFYAFISVFFSYSIVINYWLNKPNKIFTRHNYKRKQIENQQRITNWFFMSWLVRMGTFIGIVTMDFKEFSFYPTHNFIIILILIVLLGQIWMSLRFFFSKNRFKWFSVTLISFLFLSFCVSKINFSNINRVDTAILQKNVLSKNNIHVVYSEDYKKLEHLSLISEIFISAGDSIPKVILKNEEINITDSKINQALINHFDFKYISDSELPYMKYVLFIDKNIPVKYIHDLKNKLYKLDVKNLLYSVKKSTNNKLPFYYKSKYAFGFNLFSNFQNQKIPLEKRVPIKFLDNHSFLVNNKVLPITKLKDQLTFLYNNKGICPLNLIYSQKTSFEEYFKVLLTSKLAINEIRNTYTKKTYGKSYKEIKKELRMSGWKDETLIKIRKEVLNKYPWIYIDSIY